jgi:tape measure domain-containing protein
MAQRLNIEIAADSTGAVNSIKRLIDEINQLKANQANANKAAADSAAKAEASMNSMNSSINGAKNAFMGFVAVVASTAFAKKLIDDAEKWLLLSAQIKNATKTSEEFAQAQQFIIETSRKSYTSLEANAGLFSKINRALSDMGGSAKQAQALTEQVARLAGMESNANAAAAGVYQLTQSIASGKFAGDEFRSVSEQLPILASTLAKGLGVSLGTLREMSRAGQLGTEEIMRGLGNQAQAVDAMFANMPITLSKAVQNMSNSWIVFIGKLNESKGTTAALASGLNLVADNLSVVVTTGAKLAGAGLLVYFARKAQAVKAYALTVRESIAAEQAARQSEITQAQAKVTRKTQFLTEAKDKATLAAQNVALARSNEQLVRTDIAAEQQRLRAIQSTQALARSQLAAVRATFGTGTAQEAAALARLNAANLAASASTNKLAQSGALLAQTQQATARALLAQGAAQRVVLASTQYQIAAQEALNAVLARGSIIWGRLKTAAANFTSFLGGGLGVAMLGLYAAYEVLEKITDTTEQAEANAERYAQRLTKVKEALGEIKNSGELGDKFADATAKAELLRLKIAGLEQFTFDNVANLGGASAERAALLRELDATEKALQAINDRQNEMIRAFDGAGKSPKELNDELKKANDEIENLAAKFTSLKNLELKGTLSLDQSKELKKAENQLNAYKDRAKAINSEISGSDLSGSQLKKNQAKVEQLAELQKQSYEKSTAELDRAEREKLAIIERSTLSQSAKQQQTLDTELEFNRRKLEAANQYNLARLKQTEQLYQSEIQRIKSLPNPLSTVELEKQAGEAKKAILLDIEKSHTDSIARLNAIESSHRDKSIQYQRDIENAQQARQQRRNAAELEGLTGTAAYAKQEEQIAREQAAIKELLKKGEFDKAIARSEALEAKQAALIKSSADAEMEAIQAAAKARQDYASGAVKSAMGQTLTADESSALRYGSERESDIASKTNATLKLAEIERQTDSIRKQAAANELAQADKAKAAADKQKESLALVEKQLLDINTAIQAVNELKIKVDTTELDAVIAKIQLLNGNSNININATGAAAQTQLTNAINNQTRPIAQTQQQQGQTLDQVKLDLSMGDKKASAVGNRAELTALIEEIMRQNRSKSR